MAQTPTATVNDYLSEVRIFAPGSPDFAKIASALGVDATLPTLGPGASLIVAVRNDSGQGAEIRILFQGIKNGKTVSSNLQVGRTLAAGEATLVAPREISGVVAELLNAGKPGLITGGPARPLDVYQGAVVSVSVDSATLASGKFIGRDTQNLFDQLVADDKAKKKFFSDLTGWLEAGEPQAQIEQALTKRAANADAAKSYDNWAAFSESTLSRSALSRIKQWGMANLTSWAMKESATWAAKPSIHR
jgi:hypothetical protein